MKKKILNTIIVLILLVLYLLIGKHFDIFLLCPINTVTGLYCPGCGITRMLLSILKFDFYQAFRYNPLLFIFLPIIIIHYIDTLISFYKKKDYFLKRFEPIIWYVLIGIFVIYGIMRNIPYFSYLLPTKI